MVGETVTLGSTTIPAHGHLMNSMTLVAVGSHTHQVYQRSTPTGGTNLTDAAFMARSDYLGGNTSATILDQADRHIHFLGGHTDKTGAASPSPITVSGHASVHALDNQDVRGGTMSVDLGLDDLVKGVSKQYLSGFRTPRGELADRHGEGGPHAVQ